MTVIILRCIKPNRKTDTYELAPGIKSVGLYILVSNALSRAGFFEFPCIANRDQSQSIIRPIERQKSHSKARKLVSIWVTRIATLERKKELH